MPTFNTTVEVEFKVFCATCGAGLCGISKTSRRGMPYIEVEPCLNCLELAAKKGYEDGYENGYVSGRGL